MSPARARTSVTEIVAAGRDLLEAGGLEAVTMLAVAQRVGVQAPSLYKRLPSRAALVAAIGAAAFDDLGRHLASLSRGLDAAEDLRSMAVGYRAFARANPRAYELLFMNLPQEFRAPVEHSADASRPLLVLAEQLVGADQALQAARLVTAFAHGFITMELAGAFRLGGDVNEAYRYGIDVLVEALLNGRDIRRSNPEDAGATR